MEAKEAVREHFDRLSVRGEWSHLYAQADGFTYQFHVRRMRVLELLPPRLGRVADIGCGPGVLVEPVLERGGTFEGLDLSRQMVEEARRRFGDCEGVSFQCGDIEAPALASNRYDQVICVAVLEYLKTPERALAQIVRILKPGGLAIVTIPKRWHIDRFTVGALWPLRAFAWALGWRSRDSLPRLCLQPRELDAWALKAGLFPEGGSHYFFKLFPYPLTRLAPDWCMRVNLRFERWHATRTAVASFFAHGYVGRYRKPLPSTLA